MRKLFFWAYRTDSTDCLTSAVVAKSGEMALPGFPGGYPGTRAVQFFHCASPSWADRQVAASPSWADRQVHSMLHDVHPTLGDGMVLV
eukprot:137030-Rhodomonas_salina.1